MDITALNSAPDDDSATARGREILARNVANINAGLRLADQLVQGMLDHNALRTQRATEGLLTLMRSLDDDAREQMTIGAFTTAVQLRSQLRRGF